jgi:hypothetical protein
VGDTSEETLVVDPAWLILEKPRPNLNPPRFIALGKLTVERGRAEFGPSDGTFPWPWGGRNADVHLSMDKVVGVSLERYGWGMVPRFVAISYETAGGLAVAYFNDGGRNGWRPLVSGSNRRLVAAARRAAGLG